MTIRFSVSAGDVSAVPADLLLLKHAGAFFGADQEVANALVGAGRCSFEQLEVGLNEHVVVDAGGAVVARRVMFVGTELLGRFGYPEMKAFARWSIAAIAMSGLGVRRVTTTVHGIGYGLDAEEALSSLVEGFRGGESAVGRRVVDEIVFVERNERRAERLADALRRLAPPSAATAAEPPPAPVAAVAGEPRHAAGGPPKRHVFVAMPFSEEFEDVYVYGIYEPIRRCGLICEKTSESAFTGDILQRIRDRIETADLVVAEMSGARPNVYLEVGYAWGKGIPVVFVARHGEALHFDVSRHRCLYYKSIRQLASDLERLVQGLLAGEGTEAPSGRR